MIENVSNKFTFFLIFTCFVWTGVAQDKPATDKAEIKKEEGKTTGESKNKPAAAPETDGKSAEGEKAPEAASPTPPTASDGSAEESAPEEEAPVAEEGAATNEDKGETAAEEGDTAAAEPPTESPAEPAAVNLDMKALGGMDPEKELQETEPVDEAAAAGKAADDWTERELDILELHGYFRVRPELYHKFAMRQDTAIFNQTAEQLQHSKDYKNSTLAGANMRFRLEPTLNISEEIRIKSQIDFLDNIMLGSTPRYWQRGFGYGAQSSERIAVGRIQGWNMGPPDSSQMVVVRRAWGEVMTPLGQLRFGRMGDHWGLGMLHNSGNGLDDDFGDSVDRIMFAAKINNWLIAPAFDFPNEGLSASDASGRPFDVSQLDDAYRLVGMFAYKHDQEEQDAMIKRGEWVINTGLYFSYRWQILSFETADTSSGVIDYDDLTELEETDTTPAETPPEFYKRETWTIDPDLWFQLLVGTFHLELEAALIYGKVGKPDITQSDEMTPLTLIQWGTLFQIDYGLLSDALRIGLEFGYAQGDRDVQSLRAPATYDQNNDTQDDTFTAFSFNPAYNTDLILHQHILGSVSQSFYIDARVQYDFLKNTMGRKLTLRGDVLYSRAVFKDSTIDGRSGNLGVELNAQVRYMSDDGFYAGFAYGVLFPMAAFKGDPDGDETLYVKDTDLSIPQTVQMVLGITY